MCARGKLADFLHAGGFVRLEFGFCEFEGLRRKLSCLMGWVINGQKSRHKEGLRGIEDYGLEQ